jgi:hypothetical protein
MVVNVVSLCSGPLVIVGVVSPVFQRNVFVCRPSLPSMIVSPKQMDGFNIAESGHGRGKNISTLSCDEGMIF